MSKKQFIEKAGATCRNWRNMAWSFVNHTDKVVIFGAFEFLDAQSRPDNGNIIFADSWQTYDNGHKAAGYKPARENIERVLWEGYELKTFKQEYGEGNPLTGSARVKSFDKKLEKKALLREGDCWYALPYIGHTNS